MKQAFREPNIRTADRKRLAEKVLETISTHVTHGIARVTSRQLYYRLVAANEIPNTERSYKRITSLLADMRYWGWIDWDFIVDLGREPIVPTEFADVNDLAQAAVRSLRYDRWKGQDTYVEVWVEKQALQSVLEPIGRRLHVPIVVNKGYTSASAMYQAARRLSYAKRAKGSNLHVLYFGDLDPSGEDMVRDITDRLHEFRARPKIRKIALTLDQVLQYECPPNPAKTTDSRFRGFAESMADSQTYADVCAAQQLDASETYSWELDSMPVEALSALVTSTVEELIVDADAVDEVKAREKRDRRALVKAADAIERGEFSADDEDDEDDEDTEDDE